MSKVWEGALLLEEWRSSGLTQQAFCDLHGIGLHRLSYQIRKEKSFSLDVGGFRRIEKNRTEVFGELRVVYPNGVKIECGVNLSVLRELVHLY